MNNNIRRSTLSIILIGLTALSAQNYRLPEWVIDAGGVKATSGSYIGYGSFHQTTIGYATGGNYRAWIGFWHPRPQSGPKHDVAAVRILAPLGVVDTINPVTPKAEVANLGSVSEMFSVVFSIKRGNTTVYQNPKVVTVDAGRTALVTFQSYRLRNLGAHTARCSVYLATDTNPSNDTVAAVFKVLDRPNWPEGWREVEPAPAYPSGRAVRGGGFIVADPVTDMIYIAKGNKSADFYRYNPLNNTWDSLPHWPDGREGKKPGKGATACSDHNGYIYALKGNNTSGFWRHNCYNNEWEQLPDVPGIRKVKVGCDMECVNDMGVRYIYLLKGPRNEFYRYNILRQEWEELPTAPGLRKWAQGSWLVSDGEASLFAHKGKYHEFYCYDLLLGAWQMTPLTGMPVSSPTMLTRKRSKDGGSATWAFNSILALKGGNTSEFWRYFPEGDSWIELDTIPTVGTTGVKKRVKDGGDITCWRNGVLFALKGNKTCEVWRYVPGTGIASPLPTERSAVAGTTGKLNLGYLHIPNPARNRRLKINYSLGTAKAGDLTIFDAAGRTIYTRRIVAPEGTIELAPRLVSNGVYFVRLASEKQVLTAKVVVSP